MIIILKSEKILNYSKLKKTPVYKLTARVAILIICTRRDITMFLLVTAINSEAHVNIIICYPEV